LKKNNNPGEKQINCLVCQESKNKYLYTVNSFPVVKCLSCGFIFSQPNPGQINFSELYSQNYFHGDDYVNYLADEEIIKKNFKGFLKLIKPHQPQGRLLEIGSAYGFFLDEAKNNYECTGQEISKDAADYAKRKHNSNILNGDLIDLQLKENSFDLVVMWDTIEHLQHPDLYLSEIHKILKDKGYLFFTTGNIDGIIPKVKGRQWRLMKPPWHLHYFSKKTVTQLLQRLHYEVLEVRSAGFHRSLEMIITKLLSKYPAGKQLSEKLLSVSNLKS